LAEFRNLYLDTTLGRIDLLGSLPPVGDFDRVRANSVEVDLGTLRCRLVALDDLIAVKAHVGRPKDKAVELEPRAIRANEDPITSERAHSSWKFCSSPRNAGEPLDALGPRAPGASEEGRRLVAAAAILPGTSARITRNGVVTAPGASAARPRA
jgi:hypothetical protein